MTPAEPPPEVPREFFVFSRGTSPNKSWWGVKQIEREISKSDRLLEVSARGYMRDCYRTGSETDRANSRIAYSIDAPPRILAISPERAIFEAWRGGPGDLARVNASAFGSEAKNPPAHFDPSFIPKGLVMRQCLVSNHSKCSTAMSKSSDRAARAWGRGKFSGRNRKATWHRRFWRTMAYGARVERPSGLLVGWWLWDRLSNRIWPSFVPAECPYGTFKVRVSQFCGPRLRLPESSVISVGAPIIELHCNNAAVVAMTRKGESLISACRQDLTGIAAWVERQDLQPEAIFGVTLLSAAAARLGFHQRSIPLTLRARADRLFMNGLLALYNYDGVRRLSRGRTFSAIPQEVWMSRSELLKRYRKASSTTILPGSLVKSIEQRAALRPIPASAPCLAAISLACVHTNSSPQRQQTVSGLEASA